jgi:hypothetical protein
MAPFHSISCNVREKKTGYIRLGVQTDFYNYAHEFPVFCECTATDD